MAEPRTLALTFNKEQEWEGHKSWSFKQPDGAYWTVYEFQSPVAGCIRANHLNLETEYTVSEKVVPKKSGEGTWTKRTILGCPEFKYEPPNRGGSPDLSELHAKLDRIIELLDGAVLPALFSITERGDSVRSTPPAAPAQREGVGRGDLPESTPRGPVQAAAARDTPTPSLPPELSGALSGKGIPVHKHDTWVRIHCRQKGLEMPRDLAQVLENVGRL